MGKKNETELAHLVEDLVNDVNVDRERIVEFTDRLISDYGEEGQSAGIAEYVAKLTEAMTRQHHVKVATIKALAKSLEGGEPEEDEDLSSEIGPAFDQDTDGAN